MDNWQAPRSTPPGNSTVRRATPAQYSHWWRHPFDATMTAMPSTKPRCRRRMSPIANRRLRGNGQIAVNTIRLRKSARRQRVPCRSPDAVQCVGRGTSFFPFFAFQNGVPPQLVPSTSLQHTSQSAEGSTSIRLNLIDRLWRVLGCTSSGGGRGETPSFPSQRYENEDETEPPGSYSDPPT